MNLKILFLIVPVLFLLTGCSSKQLYLAGPKIGNKQPDILKVCLNEALQKMNSGIPPLSDKEKIPLNGVETDYFLWWGSLAGPKPVITRQSLPGEARTSFPVLDEKKKELSERYVLCLLKNNYSWPKDEWVKERFKKKN